MAQVPAPLPYGGHQARGRLMQDWLNGATVPGCPIVGPGPWNYQAINNWVPVTETYTLPDEQNFPEIYETADQEQINGPWVLHILTSHEVGPGGLPVTLNDFQSFSAPGYLFLMSLFRHDGPQFSQIAHVMYERVSPISELRHVLVTDVLNDDTKNFIEHQIYTANNGLTLSSLETRTFVYGTAEYEGLLGTRIAAVVAYILLGGLPRGSRRISQITVSWPRGGITGIQLRFDIEELNTTPAPLPPPRTSPLRSCNSPLSVREYRKQTLRSEL